MNKLAKILESVKAEASISGHDKRGTFSSARPNVLYRMPVKSSLAHTVPTDPSIGAVVDEVVDYGQQEVAEVIKAYGEGDIHTVPSLEGAPNGVVVQIALIRVPDIIKFLNTARKLGYQTK